MIKVNAIGDVCPLPVVKTKHAIKELNGAGMVQILVDNEIAVQNLIKMANQKGYGSKSEKLEDKKYQVTMTIGDAAEEITEEVSEEAPVCIPQAREETVVVISSQVMGEGTEELGKILLKGFIFALTQQEVLPKTILFYNGGAALTCKESALLEDLKVLEAEGVEILTCGTCLDYYGLKEELQVGEITNMYTIVEKMTQADKVVKP